MKKILGPAEKQPIAPAGMLIATLGNSVNPAVVGYSIVETA
jgi:hypothetical protein